MSHNINQGEVLLSWTYPEFIKYKKNKRWYIIALAVGILFLVFAVFTYNFLLSVIVVMVAMIIVIRDKMEPKMIEFAVTEIGIKIGDNFYPFREFSNFSIIYNPPAVKILYLEFKSKLRPRFSIFLEDQDPKKIREILKEHIEENLERQGESLSDAIARWLRI